MWQGHFYSCNTSVLLEELINRAEVPKVPRVSLSYEKINCKLISWAVKNL